MIEGAADASGGSTGEFWKRMRSGVFAFTSGFLCLFLVESVLRYGGRTMIPPFFLITLALYGLLGVLLGILASLTFFFLSRWLKRVDGVFWAALVVVVSLATITVRATRGLSILQWVIAGVLFLFWLLVSFSVSDLRFRLPFPKKLASLSMRGIAVAFVLVAACGWGWLTWRQPEQVLVRDPQPGHSSSTKPNLILITMDTARGDHVSCYGYPKQTTPNLDRLAKEGVVFRHAYAPSPWTVPSHASLLTGLYPLEHGAHPQLGTGWLYGLHESKVTLAEILWEEGYTTGAVVGNPLCGSSLGFAQGFQYFFEYTPDVRSIMRHLSVYRVLRRFFSLGELAHRFGWGGQRLASQVNEAVFPWLEASRRAPFFLFINYMDPHGPYIPPRAFVSQLGEYGSPSKKEAPRRFSGAADGVRAYDGEIAFADYHVGRLVNRLKQMGVYEKTMIVVTSDHGEGFGEHGYYGHGNTLHEELLKVHLIVKYPFGQKRGGFSEPVSLVNLLPIFLEHLGIATPRPLAGELRALGGGVLAEYYPKAGESAGKRFASRSIALYNDRYKFIWSEKGQYELYDMVRDPDERKNLIEAMPQRVDEMELMLQRHVASLEPAPGEKTRMDDSVEEDLRALGYIR